MPSSDIRHPAGVRKRRHASRATSSAYFGVTMRLRTQKRTTASGPARRGGGSGGSVDVGLFETPRTPRAQDHK